MIPLLLELKDRLDKETLVRRLLEGQMQEAVRSGCNGDFQRGYVCALYHTWQSAGYPATAASIAAEALVKGGILASDGVPD
ncbi:hypothetical protein QMZ05_12745 [Bradyrhizobium sp. INPA03-11B]|uniref:hypothetical protein n=1 Tax=Bradyrhizobium sp. INPA03-11B TaxID=418598 RepID=UPI00338E9D5E